MHYAKKTMQWNKKTMRMDKWTIAMVRFKHRNGFYDTKKWFLSNPPTWIFWRKIKSFYNYILIIYIFYLIRCTFWDTLCPKKWLMSLIAMKRNYLICKFIDQKKVGQWTGRFVVHFADHYYWHIKTIQRTLAEKLIDNHTKIGEK